MLLVLLLELRNIYYLKITITVSDTLQDVQNDAISCLSAFRSQQGQVQKLAGLMVMKFCFRPHDVH